MANIVPGVVWQPIDVGNRAARRKGRGLCGHVAVSGAKNLVPGPLSSRSADWHLYLPKSGPAIQYIDLDKQCWATGAGNASMVAFESEGGLGTAAQVNAEPWTDNQLDWAARILRHLHDTEGVPLRVMASSATAERGFGTHRLGVPGYMAAGGEQWSSARGKLCPGDAKHAQRFEIVRRAGGLTTTTSGDDVSWKDGIGYDVQQITGSSQQADAVLAGIFGRTTRIEQMLNQIIGSDPDKNGVDRLGDLWEQEDRHHAELLAAVLGKGGTVDPAVLAAAIKEAFGDQLAADVAARLTVSAKPAEHPQS